MKFSRIVWAFVLSISLNGVTNACQRHYTLDDFIPYLTASYLQQRVQEVAHRIDTDYAGKEITIVSVLEGARPFTRDLKNALKSKTQVVEVTAKSYEGTESKDLTISGLDSIYLKDKDVLIVDDICDTAKTLKKLVEKVQEKQPTSVKTCVLLMKNTSKNSTKYQPDYQAVEIEDRFVIGYGLDYDGAYRDLNCVMALKSSAA